MAKRMLGLFLALCLIVGMLPVVTMAEEATEPAKTAYVTVASGSKAAPAKWTPKMSEGMAAVYAKTVDGIITTVGASEADYNLKAEWPAEGKPTLTLKNATINNDYVYPDKVDTIAIEGTADFVIQVVGTNTLNCYPANSGDTMVQKISAYRCPFGIRADNTGELTIRGEDKTKDSLAIHAWGGNGFTRYYGATVIENLDFLIKLYKNSTASSHAAHGLLLMCGESGKYNDKTGLTVRGCNFYINGGTNYAAKLIVVGIDNDEYSSTNTSDILFQNSVVSFNRNNSSGQASAAISHGSGTTITFDRCDTGSTFYAWRVLFAYMPTIINYAKATYTDDTPKTYDYDPTLAGTSKKVRKVTVTHECLPGEPVIEKNPAECTTTQDVVTYCQICNKELSRETQEITEPGKIHTPGNKTLVKQTNAVLTTSSVAYQPGTYQWQYTCSACGETWEETEEFNPGVMWYIKPSNDYYSYTQKNPETGKNETIKVLTTPAYQFNSYWASNRYSPTHTIQPGATLYFQVLDNKNANIPTNSYMIQTTDATVIANETWNIKVEYPVGGNPVMTLNNVNLVNCAGIWWGYTRHYDLAPLTVVLKGDNYITQPVYTNGGALNFDTKGDVTITGDGTLNISAIGNYAAIRSYGGDIIFDHVNVNVVNTTAGSCGNAIDATGGDIIIDGGSFTMTGATTSVGEAYHGLNAAGDIVIKGGANVSLTQALSTNSYYMLNAGGNVVISESTVRLACGFRGYAIKCGGELTLDYANGFTANSIHEDTVLVVEKDEETGTVTNSYYTYPNLDDADVLTTTADVVKNLSRRYLDITPVKTLEKFNGTRVGVENDLILEFALAATNIPTGSIAYVSRIKNGVEETREIPLTDAILKNGYYVIAYTGIAAKEMHDEITVVVKDADGKQITEKKTDSIYDYTVRMLRGEKDPEMTNAKYAALKTILVDMLNYGTMAQVQFNYNTNSLANAVLTPNEWTYASAEMLETPFVAATVEQEDGVTTTHLGTAYELKSNISMLIAVDNAQLGKGSYAMVTIEGAESAVKISATDANTYSIYTFNGMVATDGRKTVTFEIYNADGVLALTVTDSLAAYVGRNVAKYPYLANLMNYCDSAAAYFEAV